MRCGSAQGEPLDYFLIISILSLIEVTFHPLFSKRSWIRGISCRTFAAAALPLTSKHQLSPSIGPALMAGRRAAGSSDSIDLSLSLDS